jgi:iron complex transport system substrate-binding protein
MSAGAYPGWNRLKAMREKRICRFTDKQADVLVRPGPRLGEAAGILAQCLESATR